jgi:sodium/hydrogen antiporter
VEYFVETLALIGIVIIVASLLSGALERSGVPLVAVFLGLGAALGPWGLGLVDIGLGSPVLRILATVGLALVLFSDAVTIDTRAVRSRWPLVWRMLGPGTLAPALIIALAAWYLLRIPGPAAALLGAALASTDPVLLRSMLRSKALPPTPRLALRLETGLDDVVLVPIVVFSMLLMAAGPGGPSPATVGRHAFGLLILGPVLGALVGWLGISVLIRVRDRVGVRRDYESLYALGLALSAYAAAEAVGGSGFLAAFAAGFVVAAQDVELCDCFMEYGEATAEMLLLFTFVALGTSVIWTGFTVLDAPTLLFAAVALLARTVLLLPILAGKSLGLAVRDRRLIALFGPRGLSSLLFALLPVFAGVPGAERLFTVTCLVVLLSVVLHGSGIALFLRANSTAEASTAAGASSPALESTRPGALAGVPDRIQIAELQQLLTEAEPPVIVDTRKDSGYDAATTQARGAIRLPPDDPVRAASERGLARHATLIVYCA